MVVRAQLTAAGAVQVPLAISNEAGTEPLIIRKGTALATLHRIPETNMQHNKKAEWQPSCDVVPVPSKVPQAAEMQSQSTAAAVTDNQAAEATHSAEKDLIWDMIHDKSGQDIVQMVKEGAQIGTSTFEQWKQAIAGDLKFGPRISDTLKEDLQCLLYALRLVVAKDPKKPGVMKGFEGTITLVDPDTAPVKCKHRRYSPKECEIIKKEVLELYANGMIEQSDSPWSAPVVLVKKKDGKWRFCVNYTATVNRFLRHDAHPLANA